MNISKEASINLIGLMFETYTDACQSTNHASNFQLECRAAGQLI